MKLLEQVREVVRLKHYSTRAEELLRRLDPRTPGVAALAPRPHLWAALRVDTNVTADLRLTRQDVALSLVLIGKRVLDGHTHITGKELDTARCACTRSASVIDEDTGVIGDIEDRRIDRRRRDRIGSLKYNLAG